MHGLSTISVTGDGKVLLYSNGVMRHFLARRSDEFWETATMTLPPAGIRELAGVVVESGVTRLDREYHSGIQNGNQWV